jgi:hypothetical protein
MSESVMEIDVSGTKIWRNSKGEHHRTDGPAIEWTNGDKAWCVGGKYHRTNGPAVELLNGKKVWWVGGKLHRTDGPALEYESGTKVWWVNDKYLGHGEEGFWTLWELLSDEDRANPTLLSYLPGGFNV